MPPARTAPALVGCLLTALAAVGCARTDGGKDIELRRFSLDTTDGVIQRSGVEVDRRIKAEGAGSLKITVAEPAIVRLFETGPLDIDDAALIYRARLRTENARGNVYLEMWCRFPGKGEFFSRGLQSPVQGTVEWTTQEIPFFLKKGEKPEEVKLDIVSEGPATIWVDDIRLIRRPLPRPNS